MHVLAAPGDTWGISGPRFLVLYGVLMVVALASVLVVRRFVLGGRLREPYRYPVTELPDGVAYLNGGPMLTLLAALGGLRARGLIQAVSKRRVRSRGRLDADASWVERAVYQAAVAGANRRQLMGDRGVQSTLADVERQLVSSGLLTSGPGRLLIRLAALNMVLVTAFGIVRWIAGNSAGKPTNYLLGLIILSAILTLFVVNAPRRTRAGDQALAAIRGEHQWLRAAYQPSMATYGGAAAVLGIGLFGVSTLITMDPAFAEEIQARQFVSTTGSGGGSSDGGGSSGCGSSGGDGGGGGGGGCGG